MRMTKVLKNLGRVVAYYPGLKIITKSTVASILLCQFLYWKSKTTSEDGSFYKTSEELEMETGLTYEEQRTARAKLVELGIITERYARLEHTIYFTVDEEKIDDLWEEASGQCQVPEQGNAKMGNKAMPNSLNSNTEITTQITTETTINNVSANSEIEKQDPSIAYKERIKKALFTGIENHQRKLQNGESYVANFPSDVQEVIGKVCKLWSITPPQKSSNSFSYWIKSARDLRATCGEYGLEIIDEVFDRIPPEMVSGPASLINVARAKVAEHNRTVSPIAPDQDDMSYHWNSELSVAENERLMAEKMQKESCHDGHPGAL